MTQEAKIIGQVKELPLTGGMVALVDAEDYEELAKHKWYAKASLRKNAPPCFYACRSAWIDGKSHSIRMHREITGACKGEDVDHRNGNGLDNRRENLRRCTRSENARAAHVFKGGASKYKGVYHKPVHPFSPWGVSINTDDGLKHIGYFKTEEEAAVAYDMAAIEYHGDYAITNVFSSYSIDKLRALRSKLAIAVEALESVGGLSVISANTNDTEVARILNEELKPFTDKAEEALSKISSL